LKINYTDVHTPNLLKKYLILLKKEQEEFIKKFKEEQNDTPQDTK